MHIIRTIIYLIVLSSNAVISSTLLFTNDQSNSGVLPEISIPPISLPTPFSQGYCLRLQCKYICFGGKSNNLQNDIHAVQNQECQWIDELHLYSYIFLGRTIRSRFLGNISDYVKHLSIFASDVEFIENGAFESKTMTGIHLESLNLKDIHKGIFQNLNDRFSHFTLIQREMPLLHVDANFFELVKYQIKKLVIHTGLETVRNLTESGCLLNSLEEVNLAYNNFGNNLTSSSFNQLSVVDELNLTHSEITYLPESIFSDIVGTLKHLDLSNNKLITINYNVFGWHTLGKDFVVHLNGNPWDCTCELRTHMLLFSVHQNEEIYCGIPKGTLVISDTFCAATETNESTSSSCSEFTNESAGEKNPVHSPPSNLPIPTPNEDLKPTLPPADDSPSADLDVDANGIIKLECQKRKRSTKDEKFPIQWPTIQFQIIGKQGFEVDIAVEAPLNASYVILWFSTVTTQYYKMEVNYKEYGLGCYGVSGYITTIENLLPDMAYTFCMILKDQLTVSPFSCKSIYIDGNLNVKYNAWLTNNMKATGITLVILGVVFCKFLGILFAFILIKQKPTLVKGSKRIATQKNDSTKIIVFPEDKTLQKFKLMEEQIAKRRSSFRRLSSVSLNSFDSNQSYMNPVSLNHYEIIPAYQRYLAFSINDTGVDVSYSEIPSKRKRSSTDPLPEVPKSTENSTPVLSPRTITIRRDNIYEEDCHV